MASPTSDAPALLDVPVVADGCFVLSHRLTEWVSRAPTMEEDVAIANIALDLLGQARGLYATFGDEDQLAYFRDAEDFRNPVICELANADFGHTMLRLLFVSSWLSQVWGAWVSHPDERVRGVAEKAVKENAYHLRHARAWVVRLGDGTAESHARMLSALSELVPFVADLGSSGFESSVSESLVVATLPSLHELGGFPSENSPLRSHRDASAAPSKPASPTPDLVELLSEMQTLARAHPGVTW
jgi:ring-1,2-phenylacetyl-CoA epoxidase subunit PaaC